MKHVVYKDIFKWIIDHLIQVCWGGACGNISKQTTEDSLKKQTNNHLQIDGLVQDCSISLAYALEILQSCTKPLK